MRQFLALVAGALTLVLSITVYAQGHGTINPRGQLTVLVSRGVTANIFDINADLTGAPANPNEFLPGAIFPVDPAKIVSAFPDNVVPFKNMLRTMILTEDGIWGAAPMQSPAKRDYFISEAMLRLMVDKASDSISWGMIISDVTLDKEKIIFGRGEL